MEFLKKIVLATLKMYRESSARIRVAHQSLYYRAIDVRYFKNKNLSATSHHFDLLTRLDNPGSYVWLLPWGHSAEQEFEHAQDFPDTYKQYLNYKNSMSEGHTVFYDLVDRKSILRNFELRNPEIVFFLFGPNAGLSPKLHFWKTLLRRYKRKNPNVKIILFMTDLHMLRHRVFFLKLRNYIDLLVNLDGSPIFNIPSIPEIRGVTNPFSDERASFINALIRKNKHRPDFVILCGTLKSPRDRIVDELRSRGIKVKTNGGIGFDYLSPEIYWENQVRAMVQICNLEINGQFAKSHLKGHFGESLLSGCVTLVDNQDSIPDTFHAGVDFYHFSDTDNLVELLKEISLSPETFLDKAINSQKKFVQVSVGANYWDHLIDRFRNLLLSHK